jgi:lipopolysaccharide cholinephosphotransferase
MNDFNYVKRYLINGDDAYHLYKLLYEITTILDKNDIVYWATGGTFIGAVRSGGLLLWDDDLDICIPEIFKIKVEKIFSEHNMLTYFKNDLYVHKIFYRSNINKKNPYPFCDIFYVKGAIMNNKKAFIHANSNALKMWPKEYFYLNDLLPLKKYKFGSYEIYCSKNYQEYMIRNYSKNWSKEGIITCNHKMNITLNPIIKIKLCVNSLQPAKPFYDPDIEKCDNDIS